MKTVSELCQFLSIPSPPTLFEIGHLSINSNTIKTGDIFCAYRGEQADGHDYIQAAIDRGAALILAERAVPTTHIPLLVIPNLRQKLSALAAWFYDYPSQHLKIIGVTGTNGKTSTTHYLAQFLYLLGHKTAVMGTVGNGLWGHLQESTHTTLDHVNLQRQLADFVNQKTEYVCMEVSSHALALNRIQDISFVTAVLTNISQDHLDFHGSMEAYAQSKAKLFAWPSLKTAILNQEDTYSKVMLKQIPLTTKVYFYSTQESFSENAARSDIVFAKELQTTLQGLSFTLASKFGEGPINTPLLGAFNVSNLLAALTTLLSLGFPLQELSKLSALLHPVKGRMEVLRYPGLPLVIIDYAHTPDALEKALKALNIYQRPIWIVFGCGGDRDSSKRPLMAKKAEQGAEHVIVTEDNSRTESINSIFEDIRKGFADPHQIKFIKDRKEAIAYALQHAPADSIILLAGKGHETYLDRQGQKIHFDERELVRDFKK